MLNWIPVEERRPTKEDANGDGYLYAVAKLTRLVTVVHINHFTAESFTYWLPFSEMPLPNCWRTATIHDLAKAGKPIPCRVRADEKRLWVSTTLHAISVSDGVDARFYCSHTNWRFCEIAE